MNTWIAPEATRIILIPTWECNLACHYCDYKWKRHEDDSLTLKCFEQEYNIGKEIPWPLWLTYLDRFRPYHLDLTGGEPTTYQYNLASLLAHLPQKSTWSITSNTLADERTLLQYDPDNCTGWTASFHYHSTDKFINNCKMLQRRGFPVRVTLVVGPGYEDKTRKAIKILRENEIPINIHPQLSQHDDEWQGWAKHMDLWNEFQDLHDGVWTYFVSDIPKRWNPHHFKACNAGQKYFMVWPDGQVLRCYSSILGEIAPLGHIGDYEPTTLMLPCDKKTCIFPCDLDPVWIEKE